MARTALVWFRRDLRVHDLPALRRAAETADQVVPLYVIDANLTSGRSAAANRNWFLARALTELADALAKRGAPMAIVRGDPRIVVPSVARDLGAVEIFVTRDGGRYGRRRDRAVADAAAAHRIAFHQSPGQLIHEPEEVVRADGGRFAVFSPYHRRWQELPRRPVLDAPDEVPGGVLPPALRQSVTAVLGDPHPTAEPDLLLEPGEAAARARLEHWAGSDALREYDSGRDRLAADGTSRLSQDLRWGTLSAADVLARCDGPGPGPSRFRSELAWRDFYAHLLWHEPRLAGESFRPELDGVWATPSDDPLVDAWREGRTGYPVVDAAMRQLLATGWMHNRARMIVASFLTKHLLVDWRVGEAHFMRHLVDGDPASNNGGWQWAASTGADAQPYFRIFNPALQGRRHDPAGDYVRRWVPELRAIAGPAVHEPAGGRYLEPIVVHAEARQRALAAFRDSARRRG